MDTLEPQQVTTEEQGVIDTRKPQTTREAVLCVAMNELVLTLRYTTVLRNRWRLLFYVAFIGNVVQLISSWLR